ncbi:MAG TPA: DUF6198 family protein [Methanocorpusculum sp.]|nr:DUF6198 family protein [Methanocorpusculum sp.]HJK57256.1 DUF6198 family protein [Methanocorpusculum sp.]HJK59950.1 DUF6198 family protein [Methanocorpusculum sp.]HJK61663.1 DUF6198 family protein [Methanocorpusculum sp.]HJK64256.1 DUF6198 family protein [Methanocorpusculum sp.]
MLTPTRRSILKRTLLLCIALGVMAVGVALSIKADLGTSPISSVPYVVSLMSEMSVGTATILINAILLVGEILIMRRQFQPIQLLQLAVVTLFGWLIDLCLWGLDGLTYADYGQQWMICIAGIIILGIGVSLEVTANLIPLPGEGLILSICTVLPIKFGNMKVITDVSLVLVAVLLSFAFLSGLYGVREGTIAAAICVGLVAKTVSRLIGPYQRRLTS